jgi:TetR/AcrR family transcriptional regulator, transcriptional repressor for nem operon
MPPTIQRTQTPTNAAVVGVNGTSTQRVAAKDPAVQKAQTRARIIEAASRLFRREGYHRTGVDTLMGRAGLTRGGFYAHFSNKSDLFSNALEHAFDASVANLMSRGLEQVMGQEWRRKASCRYLAVGHRDAPDDGCAVPTLGAEVALAPDEVKKTFARRLDDMIDRIAERLDGDRDQAIALLASWVGAMIMARAIPSRRKSADLLRAVRRFWA